MMRVTQAHRARSRESLVVAMARTIRASDRRLVFENYTEQAEAVLRCLDEEGFVVVPAFPTASMMDAGKKALRMGVHERTRAVLTVFQAMLDAAFEESSPDNRS